MSNKKAILFGVPVLLAAGIVGQTVWNHFSGNSVEADLSVYPYAIAHVSPAVESDELKGYNVWWRGCTPNPDYEHRICTAAAGVVPKSAVNVQNTESVTLDLDVSMLAVVWYVIGENCSTGICMPFVPASAPLKGTFSIYRGPGSYTEQSNGNVRRDSDMGGARYSDYFSGERIRSSAVFTGTVGLANIPATVPPFGSNGTLIFSRGRHSWALVYPPMP